MSTFSTREAVGFGWETFRKRTWFFVGATVLIGLISWVIGAVVGSVTTSSDSPGIALIAFILNLGLSSLLNMGVINYALKAHENPASVQVNDLWHPQPFSYYLAATVLVFLCVGIGFILLIVPGIIVALMLMFTPYFVIERGLGPIEAMKESKRISDGHKWQLLVFIIAIFLLNLLGALAILVGLLVTIPVSMLAIVHVYRQLQKAGNTVRMHVRASA